MACCAAQAQLVACAGGPRRTTPARCSLWQTCARTWPSYRSLACLYVPRSAHRAMTARCASW
eukprot:991821-Alexandrium_andersonii.AAC.1